MNQIYHPALRTLFTQNVVAKTSKAFRALKSPRRFAVTIFAVVLGCVWLSQIVMSIFLREPADRGMLRERIALGLFGFLIFQMLKIVYRKPVEPFEWTPSETQILKTAPIHRSALVIYRLTTTAISALLKSICFVLVMIPDLKQLLAGFIGMALGLCFLELVRVITEVIVYGVGKRNLQWIKFATATAVFALVATAIYNVASQPGVEEKLASPAAYQLILAVALQLAEFSRHSVGALLAFPFRCFSDVILTENLNVQFLQRMLLSIGFVTTACYTAMMADCWMIGACQRQDQANLHRLRLTAGQSAKNTTGAKKARSSARQITRHRFDRLAAVLWSVALPSFYRC